MPCTPYIFLCQPDSIPLSFSLGRFAVVTTTAGLLLRLGLGLRLRLRIRIRARVRF